MVMLFDPKRGWTSKKLGPKSGHWKRLARKGKVVPTQEGLGPMNQKREGLTPLQELDPNVLDQKRRRGKTQNKPTLEDEKQMDGNKAVATTQHCRAE